MSKTAICDICKRTKEDLIDQMAMIRHFRMTTWHRINHVRVDETEFDICDKCLREIRKLREGDR